MAGTERLGLELRPNPENRGSFLAVYIAKVRITVQADGVTIVREGHGSGEATGRSPGDVHDMALKAAETDATKRALATFGKPFGLELYRKDKGRSVANSANAPADERKSTHAAPSGFAPRRYDTDPAAITLLWAATAELDD